MCCPREGESSTIKVIKVQYAMRPEGRELGCGDRCRVVQGSKVHLFTSAGHDAIGYSLPTLNGNLMKLVKDLAFYQALY